MPDLPTASLQHYRTPSRPPSAKYQTVLEAVTDKPERASVIYRRWAEIEGWKSLTRRHRNELKWLGRVLQNLAADGLILREEDRGVTFRLPSKRSDPSGPPAKSGGDSV